MTRNILSMFITLFFFYVCHAELQQADNYHIYLWAHFNHLNECATVAQQCYDFLLKKPHPSMYEGYAHHLFQTQQFDKLIELMPQLEKTASNDAPLRLLCAQTLEITGKKKEALQKFIALSAEQPHNPEIIYYTAAAYVQDNQSDAAIKVIDTFLQNAPEQTKQFIFYFLKAQIYAQNNNNELALTNVKKALELYPSFDQGWLLFGLLNELAGDLDQAIKGYQQCLALVGNNELLERQLIMLQFKKQQKQQMPPRNEHFKQALELFNQKKYPEALVCVDRCLMQEPHVPSRLLKIEILCRTAQVTAAIELLKEWIKADETNDLWFRTIHLLYQAGAKSDHILQAYKTIEKHNQNNLLAVLYQADLYIRLQQNASAKEYIKKALSITQEPILRTKLLFQQARLLYQEQAWTEMHQALLEAQQLQPDFAPVLNLLAYYYATKTSDLEKAQALIEKALHLDPHNTHFLDTQAIVWYKQKEYTKAYELLVALEKQEPQDMHIKYHKAKVAYNLNNISVAKDTLNQVIALTNNEKEKAHYKARLARWNKK